MVSKTVRVAVFIIAGLCLSLGYSHSNAQARDVADRRDVPASYERAYSGQDLLPSLAAVIYSQPPSPSGGLFPSSWWDPDGSSADQYDWDNFTLGSSRSITETSWMGGYDPALFASGGPVLDFVVAFYPSIPAGTQPDILNPLVQYQTGGNAGETPAGTLGGVAMYNYHFVLPTPFQAAAGTKYWVQIYAFQHGSPDWGLTHGTGGDGVHFRKFHAGIGDWYQIVPGDAAFTLLGPWVGNFKVHIPYLTH